MKTSLKERFLRAYSQEAESLPITEGWVELECVARRMESSVDDMVDRLYQEGIFKAPEYKLWSESGFSVMGGLIRVRENGKQLALQGRIRFGMPSNGATGRIFGRKEHDGSNLGDPA